MMSFRIFVTSLLFVALTINHGVTAKNSLRRATKGCTTDNLKGCMNILQTINKDPKLAFAITEEELQNMCYTMKTGLRCVYDHVRNCFDHKRREVIYKLLQGTEEVIQLLCNPGEFRISYKIYAPCMKKVSTEDRMCGPQYQRLIHSVKPKEQLSATDTIRRQCCSFHNYLLCVTQTAVKECGHDASTFIKDYSYRTAGPLIKNQCKNYMAGSVMCLLNTSSGDNVHISYLTIHLLLFLGTISCIIHY